MTKESGAVLRGCLRRQIYHRRPVRDAVGVDTGLAPRLCCYEPEASEGVLAVVDGDAMPDRGLDLACEIDPVDGFGPLPAGIAEGQSRLERLPGRPLTDGGRVGVEVIDDHQLVHR